LADIISYVPQDSYLFGGTIRDNLLLAKPGASDDELIQACRHAQIYDIISALPEGLDTWIGEHGLRLSGGERRRLSLARGLLNNVPIYIFDEPSAHLDTQSAAAIFDYLVNHLHGATVIFITHELDTISHFDFDQIIEL
jgi:ABC-type multidrug transport system fused ATPase/permease subunit